MTDPFVDWIKQARTDKRGDGFRQNGRIFFGFLFKTYMSKLKL